MAGDRPVPPLADHRAVQHQQGADGHLAVQRRAPCEFERAAHEIDIAVGPLAISLNLAPREADRENGRQQRQQRGGAVASEL